MTVAPVAANSLSEQVVPGQLPCVTLEKRMRDVLLSVKLSIEEKVKMQETTEFFGMSASALRAALDPWWVSDHVLVVQEGARLRPRW